MAYIQKWTKFADALNRVIGTGLREAEAQRQLCQAIADGALPVRARIAENESYVGGGFVLGGNI